MAEEPHEHGPRDEPDDKALLFPGAQILVTVDLALPDILIVTCVRGNKTFQGALLDASKRGLPCGIEPPEPVDSPDGDKLTTIASRFSYFQEKKHSGCLPFSKIDHRRKVNRPTKNKNSRPTVRLRPRQVTCSNCRAICNENSENIGIGKKRKLDESNLSTEQQPLRRSDRKSSSQQQQQNNNQLRKSLNNDSDSVDERLFTKINSSNKCESSNFSPILTPADSTLQATEPISDTIHRIDKPKSRVVLAEEARSNFWNGRDDEELVAEMEVDDGADHIDIDNKIASTYSATPRRLSSSSVESAKIPLEEDEVKEKREISPQRSRSVRMARKKRSVGLMEDLWDESVFEEPIKTSTTKTTPVIKISFGSQGEGTVLKIPSKVQHSYSPESESPLSNTNTDSSLYLQNSEDYQTLTSVKDCDASAKAAKKALKKAKKKALRKMYGATSPNKSPRYSSNYDKLYYQQHKHKIKRKKKHKEERQRKNHCDEFQKVSSTNEKNENVDFEERNGNSMCIKEQCLKQKLSISLKRLNTNAYARCDYVSSNTSSGCKSTDASCSSDEAVSEHETDLCGGYQNQGQPLLMRFAARPVPNPLPAGKRMDVGDVVWGKVHGFPWWPGKVLSISDSYADSEASTGPQAHVAWYGSSTSSLMACDQLSPFLETFKARYNKKKKSGPYKEAIRQAQNEAKSQVALNPINNVLNVCESPREVNVLS